MPVILTALRDADRRPDVAELAERDERGQLAHSVESHQRATASLSARELAQFAF
jgi:hypothetical protein